MANHSITPGFDQVRDFLRYEPDTGLFFWIANPINRPPKIGTVAGTACGQGYLAIGFGGKRYMAHRLAWFFVHGELPTAFVDHVNGIKTDNRIANLRMATRTQNAQNRAATIGRKLPKGVYFSASKGYFTAQLQCAGRRVFLGTFATANAASEAYEAASRQYFREFKRGAVDCAPNFNPSHHVLADITDGSEHVEHPSNALVYGTNHSEEPAHAAGSITQGLGNV